MKTLIALSLTFFTVVMSAQDFEWAGRLGGTGGASSNAVSTDAEGNVYTTGKFTGTADFDPGIAVAELTSDGYEDIFITKVNSAGELVWARRIGGDKTDIGNAIAVDPSGNVLITGSFEDTVDFDPGIGVSEFLIELLFYSSTGTPVVHGSDVFVCKLGPDGNFVWAKQIGGNLDDFGTDIVTDDAGDVLIAGEYSNLEASDTCDFDPGPGVHNELSGGAFILRLDSDGNFEWVERFGTLAGGFSACSPSVCFYTHTYSVQFASLALDAAGNILIAGNFRLGVDFDPDEDIYLLSAHNTRDAVIVKLDGTGDFIWVKQFVAGATIEDENGKTAEAKSIVVDGSGNVITTGFFKGKVDFNPGSGTAYLTSTNPAGNTDIFISKLNSDGVYVWAKKIGAGSDDIGYAIDVDAQGNVYTTGWFGGKPDFDPGTGKYTLTASGQDIFILKFTNTGTFSWARKVGGSGDDKGAGISVDDDANVLTTGYFVGAVDFNPNSATYNLTASGGQDAFILKLSQGALLMPSDTEIEITARSALSSTMDLTIWPNPVQDQLRISFVSRQEGQNKILLMDMSGRVISTQVFTAVQGMNTFQIAVQDLTPGQYLLMIHDNHVCETRQFVKS